MKYLKTKLYTLGAGGALALGLAGTASAAGPDFSSLTGAIDATTVVAAIMAVAAIKVLPKVAKWGVGQVMGMLGR